MIQVLKYTEELEKVGFTTDQAKKSVQLWMDLMDQNLATIHDFREHYLMTKNDLKDVQNDIKNLKAELQNEIKSVRIEMKDLKTELQTEIKAVRIEIKDLKTELQTEIKDLKTELQTEIKDLKSEFHSEMKDLEHRLTIRLGIMLASGIGIISAVISFKH